MAQQKKQKAIHFGPGMPLRWALVSFLNLMDSSKPLAWLFSW
jgi:hypothetical protein